MPGRRRPGSRPLPGPVRRSSMIVSTRSSEPSGSTGPRAGQLIVLEGMPRAGKTTLAHALAAGGARVLGEYTTTSGATIPLSGHPGTVDGAAHDANWLRKAGQRCAWAQDCLAGGQLLLPNTYVIFHVTAATSLRRRSGLLDSDHPWSHPGHLQRLRYFYTWPAQVIATAHPGLAAALLEPAWHRVPGTGSPQARLRLLRELGTRQ